MAVSSEWLDLKIISEVTRPVDHLVLYPFAMVTILILARSGFLDRWGWSVPLMIIMGINLTTILLCIFFLRHAALGAQKKVLRRVEREIRRTKPGTKEAQSLERIQKELSGLHEGSFAPITKHPVIAAILLPFGSVGTVALINLLSRL